MPSGTLLEKKALITEPVADIAVEHWCLTQRSEGKVRCGVRHKWLACTLRVLPSCLG